MLPRNHWVRRSEQLDPVRDSHEISLHVSSLSRSDQPIRNDAETART